MTYRVRSTDIWHSMPGVVAAYQPIGAPSETEARFNIGAWQRMVGNYTATPGTAPTWNPKTGWTFDGATQYFVTGVGVGIYSSLIVDFNNAAIDNVYRCPAAVTTALTTERFEIYNTSGGGLDQIGLINGSAASYIHPSPRMAAGSLAIAGAAGYKNGLQLAGSLSQSGSPNLKIFLGARNNIGSAAQFFSGNLRAVLICNRVLSSAEVWQASQQMAYCDSDPAWNAWAPRRRYFISASPAIAGSVGIYGARATVALSGGVSIRATGGQT